MKKLTVCLSLAALSMCLLTGNLSAAEAKSYQVTGPVLEVTPSYIVVQKGDEKWQLATDKPATVKVGDKVTVKYQMVAKDIEVKVDKK